VVIPTLFVGENERENSDINVKDVVFFRPIIVRNCVFKTGLFGFVNGFWSVRLIKL
jgi:hypothetical protein